MCCDVQFQLLSLTSFYHLSRSFCVVWYIFLSLDSSQAHIFVPVSMNCNPVGLQQKLIEACQLSSDIFDNRWTRIVIMPRSPI
jgi:hypothetical protein